MNLNSIHWKIFLTIENWVIVLSLSLDDAIGFMVQPILHPKKSLFMRKINFHCSIERSTSALMRLSLLLYKSYIINQSHLHCTKIGFFGALILLMDEESKKNLAHNPNACQM
jgi:hypothetical protein